MRLFTTGGCGFIGSNFILDWINENHEPLVNVDCLNYAGQLANLKEIENNPLYTFVHGNINNRSLISDTLLYNAPDCVIHFAAESHAINAPHKPEHFLVNNVIGTFNLLEEALAYWKTLSPDAQQAFRFIHISTSEVYGSNDNYQPNNPYTASKASADHFVRAYYHTYGLPTITIHIGNIYGPRQYSEKLIPAMLQQALSGQQLDVYGNGQNVRDWLYVGDAVAAISLIAQHGIPGEVYNIGGEQERSNLTLIKTMCQILEKKIAHPGIASFESLIELVQGEANTDSCYNADNDKVRNELGWNANTPLNEGLDTTISWYLQQWSADLEKRLT
jgi:dTDP-glucose 4,6-dehydratase